MTGGPCGTLAWCPLPGDAPARAMANRLLDEGPAACANMLQEMQQPLLARNARRGAAKMTGGLLKTDAALLNRSNARVAGLQGHDARDHGAWAVHTRPGTPGQ